MSIRGYLYETGAPIVSASSASGGTTITPGNNVYGAFVQILSGAAVTDDCVGILINVNNLGVSGVAKDAIAQVGADPAGGTSYTVIIPDLLVSCAGGVSGVGGGGISYYFPLFIKAGTSLAIAVSTNNATVGTCTAYIRLFRQPAGIPTPRVGSFVRAFGINTGTSSGTSITPNGAGAKNAFVQVGAALTEPLWGWCLGIGVNNAVMNNNPAAWDLAIGSSTTVNRIVIADQIAYPTTAEIFYYQSFTTHALGVVGDLLFVRAGGQGASVAGMSAAAYGIGG